MLGNTWEFDHRTLGRTREPVSAAFFTADALARELVGEVGQNSHDARNGDEPVTIRYTLCSNGKAVPKDSAAEYFHGLQEHLTAIGTYESLQELGDCAHLVIEDFGTSGLTGDIHALDPPTPQEEKNHFFHFFRAENISGKSGNDGGRWGLGKVVYKMASRIDTYFAYTIRANEFPTRALMGVSILKNHTIAGDRFEPDGWLAKTGDGGMHLPFEHTRDIDHFSATWNVSRTTEPGLSVVVPYPDPSLTMPMMREYAIRDFFMPVMKGELIFEFVDETGAKVTVSKQTIVSEAKALIEDGQGEHPDDDSPSLEQICRYMEMLEPTMAQGATFDAESHLMDASTKISDMFSEESISAINSRLDAGEAARVRMRMTLKKKGVGAEETYFDLILRKEDGLALPPLYARGKLVVTKAKTTPLPGYRCIENIQHGVLSSFLGDAENPAHEEWFPNTEGLAKTYPNAAAMLRLVKMAPWRVISAIRQMEEEETRTVLPNIFTIFDPSNVAPKSPVGSGGRGGGKPTPPPVHPPGPAPRPRNPASTQEFQVDGGFGVKLSPSGIQRKVARVKISVAYARLDGKALQSWEIKDFDLSRMPVDISGGEIEALQGKHVMAKVTDPENFKLHIRGFDMNRDLYVESTGSI